MNPTPILSTIRFGAAGVLALGLGLAAAAEPAAPLPHLENRDGIVRLIVDGKPWIIRGGEVANTISTDLDAMNSVWPNLARLNFNTVLVGTAWAWVEPREGQYDFSLVDGLIDGARRNNLRLVFLWFGSWKNGLSNFAPAWVKTDQGRFPRVRIRNGHSVEILSTLAESSLQAETRAYTAFLAHLREVDSGTHTVLMIQIENEVGVLGDSRDRSDAAESAFASPVPAELLKRLALDSRALAPEISSFRASTSAVASGTWDQVFGPGPATDELFMAWNYARYMGKLAAAGKAVYPLPVFTNTWIVQPEDRGPGDFPSGGPEPRVLDAWKAGAPAIDLNAPDIYLPNFDEWVGRFHRADNPLFVPESRGDSGGAANAFYAIGEHAALGYSAFGIDDLRRFVALRPGSNEGAPANIDSFPLGRGYAVLAQLTPLILEHQAGGGVRAAWLTDAQPNKELPLGDYVLHATLRTNRRDPAPPPTSGYGIAIALAPDEFIVAGCDIQVTFSPRTPGDPIAGIADADAGSVRDGKWISVRKMNGDDILLNYDLASASGGLQSGSGLRFGPGGPTLQRVKLYRYR